MTTILERATGGQAPAATSAAASAVPASPVQPAVLVRQVTCRFGRTQALAGVDLTVPPGDVHALLGPNGAGKTTLLRVVIGLQRPASGDVRVIGAEPSLARRETRERVGLVSSNSRSFYLRLSGLENLVFFARLHGLRRRAAVERARACLEAVGLEQAASKRAGLYSQGMLRRLAVARSLLPRPSVLVVDEATHDLDPEGARQVREVVARQATGGTAVLWATQRLDEIRGFAHRVSVLHNGIVRFSGTVPQLLETAHTTSFLLRLGVADDARSLRRARTAIRAMGSLTGTADAEHHLLSLREGVVLGDAVAAITRSGVPVLSCREEQSVVATALLNLTSEEGGVGRGPGAVTA